jgi:YidC/Oxa1 family membrane protein insertase
MNNRRSASEQLIFNFLLSFLAVWFIFQYFNAPKQTKVPPRTAPTLQQAFKGIDPNAGARLTVPTATAEITKLQKNITDNPQDELAQWSRLRIGLIQQYVVGQLAPVTVPGGIFSRPWQGTIYDEVIQHHGSTAVDAQAAYQKGDHLWREGKAKGAPSHDAVTAFESLLQQSRSSKEFNDLKIYVQTLNSSDTSPVFEQKTIAQALGSTGTTDPNAILVRVDQFYQSSSLYRTVDAVVRFFGNQPATSYGLTILVLAILTRILMQPLTRKQYESMKGMTVIAPEMKKIQDKYKGKADQQAQMQMVKEIQELQRRHGVSPMLGCGLGLLQIPFFFYIVSPAMKHYEAKMELVGASFLWVNNLARPDIPLLVLYGITMFVSFRLSSLPPTDETQRQQQRMMMFMMPMFPFFLLHYPAAFAFYWMIFNLTSTILQYRMMKQGDPDKRFVKSLLGTPALVTPAEPTDIVPPRPKSGSKKPKSAALNSESEALNGTHKSEKLQVKATSDATHQNGAAKNGDKSGSSQRTRKRRQ